MMVGNDAPGMLLDIELDDVMIHHLRLLARIALVLVERRSCSFLEVVGVVVDVVGIVDVVVVEVVGIAVEVVVVAVVASVDTEVAVVVVVVVGDTVGHHLDTLA